MKPTRFALALLLAPLVAAPFALAQESPPAKKPASELEDRMEKINSAWRRLRRQATDPAQNASSLELIATIREASKGTEKLTPARIEEVPEADRAKFMADYQAGMKKFFEQVDALEAALKANNNEEAGKVLAAIAEHQKASHKAFKKAPPAAAKK
ncbi:MAG TPA: cytochrome b562 [Opitutaceae bacterium]|nr:cytochrome b562 [Opitutaceae bacterium]